MQVRILPGALTISTDKIILFDIDHTLINTNQVRVLVTRTLINFLKTTNEKFLEVEQEYRKNLKSTTDFCPEDFIKIIAKKYRTNSEKLLEVFYQGPSFSNSLYSDTIKSLDFLDGKCKLGIFSEGYETFQNNKLRLSGIQNYFDDNYKYIFRRKSTKENIGKLPINSFIIDDNLSVIKNIAQTGKFRTFWLNRKSKTNHKRIQTIFSLSEIIKLF